MTRINALMAVILVISALFLVSTQYEARRLHIDLEAAQDTTHKLDVEWSQLQLDQASLSKHALIDAAARKDLEMMPATPARTEYITLAPHGPTVPLAQAQVSKGAK
ncbi:MAG: cell division protein FtsL [Burkholderiaceae bacterium]|jgi:cell division protein FtsL